MENETYNPDDYDEDDFEDEPDSYYDYADALYGYQAAYDDEWGDQPMTDEEKRMIPFRNHPNAVVANAFGYMVDNGWTLDDYLEYIHWLDPADYRKYYGFANPEEAASILRGSDT